jgi:hypothetical protein
MLTLFDSVDSPSADLAGPPLAIEDPASGLSRDRKDADNGMQRLLARR